MCKQTQNLKFLETLFSYQSPDSFLGPWHPDVRKPGYWPWEAYDSGTLSLRCSGDVKPDRSIWVNSGTARGFVREVTPESLCGLAQVSAQQPSVTNSGMDLLEEGKLEVGSGCHTFLPGTEALPQSLYPPGAAGSGWPGWGRGEGQGRLCI